MIGLATVGALSAPAAGLDWGGMVVDTVNELITSKGDVLVHDGLLLLTFIGLGKLFLLVARMLWRRMDSFGYASWHVSIHFSEILILLFQITLCSVALQHYMVPFPGTNLSLHQIPTALARGLVADFDTATTDQFLQYVVQAVTQTSKPNPLQILEIIIYLFILLDMGLLSAAMFVVSSFGFVGVGVYVVLGPLFIPLALTKHFYGWFWNWLQGLFSFAMYRVMATAVGYVWANVYIYFFVHGMGTDFSIANWIAQLPLVVMLTVAFVYCMFKIPAMTSALFSGAGAIGQSYVEAAGSAIRAAGACFA